MEAPLSFRKAAAWLGWGDNENAARKLKRMVLSRERTTATAIATRGSGHRRPLRGVTKSAIMRHLPELKPTKLEHLQNEFAKYLAAIDDNQRRIAREEAEGVVGEIVDPQLAALSRVDEQLQIQLNSLAERVAQAGIRKAM